MHYALWMMTFVTTIITAYTTATIFILYKPIYRTYNIWILKTQKFIEMYLYVGHQEYYLLQKIANAILCIFSPFVSYMLSASMIVFSGVLWYICYAQTLLCFACAVKKITSFYKAQWINTKWCVKQHAFELKYHLQTTLVTQ